MTVGLRVTKTGIPVLNPVASQVAQSEFPDMAESQFPPLWSLSKYGP